MRAAKSILIPILFLISACSVGSVTDCTAFGAIYVSKDDKLTQQTKRQVVTHNETGERICGWEAIDRG